MNEDIEGSKRAGHFTIAPGKEISGEITFAGEKTTLYLHDKEFFSTHSLPDQAITGVFLDLRKVSLIDCITTSGPGSGGRGNESYKFAHVFPHYILLGDHHIGPKEKKVTEISFTVNDATALFYDFDAFGLVIDAKPYIGQIANANAKIHGRKVEIGDDPQIIYFSGKREIFSADTVLGKVAASHNPSHGMGGPGGISLTNTIFINITFQEPVEFETAITRFHILRQYLELLLGRPQKVSKLGVAITPASEKLPYLSVYKTMDSDRGDSDEDDNRRPHPKDILLGTIDGLRQFATVLTNWLARHQDWRSARGRFALGFS